MACGTPVIAFRRGSVPEVVDNGVTGFVVDDEAGAVAAIRRIRQLDRRRIRATFERRFSATRMAEDYLRHYAGLLQRNTLKVPIRLQHAALEDNPEVGIRLSPDDSGIVGEGSDTL